MYLSRSVSAKLRQMVQTFPVVVVSGARQVGKTTLVRHVFPQFDYVVFDPAIDLENARLEPDLFLRNHPAPVVLDEIQYAPELVAALKRRVDAADGHPGQYLVTGSQQWQVMRSISESLAGRAAFLDLDGFSLRELAGQGGMPGWLAEWLRSPSDLVATRSPAKHEHVRRLWDWLWRGFLPGVQHVPADLVSEFWTGYQRTYVERDARLAGEINDWQQFGMFIRLASALTAQEINYSQLGREIGVTPQSARRWLQVLRGTFQWWEAPAFKGNLVKRVSSKPKGYLSDTGLICHLAQLNSPRALGGHPLLGALFETAMVHEIRKQHACLPGGGAFHHWRSSGGAEVDLLLERDGWFHPFEIKLTANPTRRDAAGLAAFRQSYPHLRIGAAAILCATERAFWITDDVAALPWNWI
jgi:hypothetical protein